jgi:hypothetical protein
VHVPNQWLDFQQHMSWSFLCSVSSIKMRGDFPFWVLIFNFIQEEFEDTKGIIRIRISKKNRQHRDQKKKINRQPLCHICWPLWNICVTSHYGYVALVVSTSRSFPHSCFITGFVTRLIRRVSLVEQELLTLSEHLGQHIWHRGCHFYERKLAT